MIRFHCWVQKQSGCQLAAGCSTDQPAPRLRQADMELGKGKRVPEVCRQLEISEQTYYRWRQNPGGMAPGVAYCFLSAVT